MKVFQFEKHVQVTNAVERRFTDDAMATVVQMQGSMVEVVGSQLVHPVIVAEEKSEPDVIVQNYDPRKIEVTHDRQG